MRLFLDVLLNMLLAISFVVLILYMLVHPPKQEETSTPPGNLAITMCWPEGDVDIDMWVKAPGDEKPVGFSNRGSKTLNLLRDDLGNKNDSMPMNCENVFSRGLPNGEYIINAHYYRGKQTPVEVRFEILANNGGSSQQSLGSTVVLAREGQELTAARFRMTDGRIEMPSVTRVFQPLRAAKK